jgi:hypothetical protein
MQPLNNLVQRLNGSNETFDCARISPAIVLEESDANSIGLVDSRIILKGDDRRLHSEAIILRDVLAPEWIRRVYGMR